MTQRNVVFLVLDSLRKDRTSIHNEDVDFTPTLEELSESSIVFDNAVAQAPWTLPSHASMFTGKYPWEHGIGQSRTHFKKSQETFIQDFNEEDYTTAVITPNVWITPHKGTTKDFDHVENFLGKADNKLSITTSKYLTRVFDALPQNVKKQTEKILDSVFQYFNVDDSCKSEETVEEVEKYLSDVEDNFFLYVNLMEPHEPYHPPKKYKDRHGVEDESKIPQRQKDLFTQEIDFEELRKIYDASVDYTDDLVRRIVDSLEENNLREDTVLVVLSDHGQALGEDDIFGHQFTVDESVTNTLLMIDNPDEEPRRKDKVVELRKLHDLVPYHAGIRSKPDEIFTENAMGHYDFPSVFIGYVPDEKWDKYYNKFEYVKSKGLKTVRKTDENGNEEVTTLNVETGEEVEANEEHASLLESISSDEEEVQEVEEDAEEPEDEEIKKRLEDLGYS